MMEPGPRLGAGRGGAILKTSAMERIAKYSNISKPTLQRPSPVVQTSNGPGVKQTGTNINVPLARLKPQYRAILESDGRPPLRRSDSPQLTNHGLLSMKNNNVIDTNNNNSTPSPIKFQRKSNEFGHEAVGGDGDKSLSPTKIETLREKVTKCICYRPKTHILCTICGYSTFGHVRTPCYAHLRVTYLLDMATCPRCNSGRLMEVTPPNSSPTK